jgi:hypothetical protein
MPFGNTLTPITGPLTKAYEEGFQRTFADSKVLTFSRYLEEGQDDETFAEWRERMQRR